MIVELGSQLVDSNEFVTVHRGMKLIQPQTHFQCDSDEITQTWVELVVSPTLH